MYLRAVAPGTKRTISVSVLGSHTENKLLGFHIDLKLSFFSGGFLLDRKGDILNTKKSG